jgi:NADPH:quinone reductase-like Zn-dependent oxidoreductase
VHPIARGETVLIHGVAGGLGGILCEIAHLRGGARHRDGHAH